MQFFFKVNSLIKLTISLFLLLFSPHFLSQTWDHEISSDFEFRVRDRWGETGNYEAKFVVANLRTAFVKKIEVFDDQWGTVLFPDEFEHTRGNFNPDTLTEFDWYIEVKNKIVAEGHVIYDSSPNTTLQLDKFDPIGIRDKLQYWGDVEDAYSWLDKNGENIFIRTKLVVDNGTYIYHYHYLKEEEEYTLVRKLTDYVTNCKTNLIADNIPESIELTDVDRDTIGEISFIYVVDCKKEEQLKTTKLMLLTKGKKYAIRGTSEYCHDDTNIDFITGEPIKGSELKEHPVLDRFLSKKWQSYGKVEQESEE